ncbi:circularly permuted type 2 ATP-grasp protein [Calidifontibacter sp. DB0510]|uniref:Circularly permuted type 2 ATP-grasp protein n=1 Tax=Metallococcus carri TaxID=1656884 RepID=A0A967B0S3_9MICO|nr:circularly permuted type 2 ATP-grasp protein [Metallococcus carri]NHN55333.1 circularly permuted type 2 ATP-grasp protein [Metallococcus carri]NOP36410.1 circularly permuted type 2 ATP-grasp protein [Calidifontibacter sp. DB2511S]
MFQAQEQVRGAYAGVQRQVQGLTLADLSARAEYLSHTYLDQGVTFDLGGEERPFPIDIVPRLIDNQSWQAVETGVAQRVAALEAFLSDIYGEGQVFNDRVIPRRVVTSSPHFLRVAKGVEPPGKVRVHVAGIDLIRDSDGTFRVLEDNVRIPSGVSYVMTNRRAMSAALPEAFAHHRIRPVSQYPGKLLAALRACAPSGVTDPTVVVLTPGAYNAAYFEHALLARLMGVRLVEGRDLLAQGGRVMVRTTHGLFPVHVIYRRVDDDFLDPVAFRRDSVLGVPGLLNAARSGNVTIANAVGNGVADDKLVYTYVPDLIRYYLGQEPILPNVDTWRMEDPEHRAQVLDRLDELVLKPVDGAGGKGIVIGPRATKAELADLRARLLADPRGWIAQPVVQLSTVPTLVGDRLAPRHVDLRPFAINDGEKVWVLPGGLTRVALPEGELIVNSSQGGGSKDTWVLAAEPTDTQIQVQSAAEGAVLHPGLRAGRMGQAQTPTGMVQSMGGMTQVLGTPFGSEH